MNNEDLQRFYEVGTDLGRPGDFVRRDKDGKIPGSGGGTTLNEYTFSVNIKPTGSYLTTIRNILNNAKRILNVDVGMEIDGRHSFMSQKITSLGWEAYSITAVSTNYYVHHVSLNMNISSLKAYKTEYKNPSFSTEERTITDFSIRYINDTEIT